MQNEKITCMELLSREIQFPECRLGVYVEGEESALTFTCTDLEWRELTKNPPKNFVDLLGIGECYAGVTPKKRVSIGAWKWELGEETLTAGEDKYIIKRADESDDFILVLGSAEYSDVRFYFAKSADKKKLKNLAMDLIGLKSKLYVVQEFKR
jgi:hypothetical protein